jgi:hypothetical protein
MKILLVVALIFAQSQTSQFVRPTFPRAKQWKEQHKRPVGRQIDFVMPLSGSYTFEYQKIYPCTYDGETCKAIPQFCDHHDMQLVPDRRGEWSLLFSCYGANHAAIYDVNESLDHITVEAKPGTQWRFNLLLAVPE